MKKKNKVNLKRVVKARGGQDMGAGSSGMGSGNTGNTGTGGQVDTGDLGTEAANVAANVAATSHTGDTTGNKTTDPSGKVTVRKGPLQVPGPFAYTFSGALFNKISKDLYNKKNLEEQKKTDVLGGEMLTQGKPPGPPSGGGGGGSNQQITPTRPTPAKPVMARRPMLPFYMGFDFQNSNRKKEKNFSFKRGGLSGGKRFGPPPKKGPNPHGKCPFRPDGIRGVGAVQKGRGVKFVGVK